MILSSDCRSSSVPHRHLMAVAGEFGQLETIRITAAGLSIRANRAAMNDYFEAHWQEWLEELRIPASPTTRTEADRLLHEELKKRQVAALHACLAFHLKSFPAGSRPEAVCDELNQGRFYSLATVTRNSPRVPRQAAGSVFKDVLLAQGCWLNQAPDWDVSHLYRDRFFEANYSGWSEWIGHKPNGQEYLQRRGNRYFERFCGRLPVLKRKHPYICDYRGEWDLKTYLALLTQGDYTDFLAKAAIPGPLVQDVSSFDAPADFENDECCQKAARALIASIENNAFGTLSNDDLSLLYLFLLGEEEPHHTLAGLTDQPEERFLQRYQELQKRIQSTLNGAVTLHKHRCPCWKQFSRNHQIRGRCRCLAYVQHQDWYHATHEKLFQQQFQHLLKQFAQHCDSLLNRQRS